MARKPARKSTPNAAPEPPPPRTATGRRRPRENHRGLAGTACRKADRADRSSPKSPKAPACRSRNCAASSPRRSRSLPPISRTLDRAVLAADFSDMAEEPPRERLFDVLMRRLEILAPHRDAVRSLLRSAAPQSAARPGAQRPRGAIAAMDADRGRNRRVGPARHDARARARAVVRFGAAHLGP